MNFDIEHTQGRLHGNADALSRRRCIENECAYCAKASKVATITAYTKVLSR